MNVRRSTESFLDARPEREDKWVEGGRDKIIEFARGGKVRAFEKIRFCTMKGAAREFFLLQLD
jgi:hypothetical protein